MCVEGKGNSSSGEGASGGSSGTLNVEALPPELMPYADAIQAAADAADLDPNLLAAVIWAESRGDPNTTSYNDGNGAIDVGLMQISQLTYNEIRGQIPSLASLDVDDPVSNIFAGAFELRTKIDAANSVAGGLNEYVGGDPNYVPRVSMFYQDMVTGIQMPQQDPI